MAYKPPYGIMDRLLASPKREREMNDANRRYREGYQRGRGFRDGSK